MEILNTIITACGGAAVAGIFSLILANRKNKSEIVKRLDALDGKLVKHIEDDANCRADEARSRILRFGDEVRQGVLHTAEHWADVLRPAKKPYCGSAPSAQQTTVVSPMRWTFSLSASR